MDPPPDMDTVLHLNTAPPSSPTEAALLLLIPVFDDWGAIRELLPLLDRALAEVGEGVSVLLVDDGSTRDPGPLLPAEGLATIGRVEILRLRRNLGHQRAIALGLAYVHEHRPCREVVVMDGDGEDLPADVLRLLAALEEADDEPIVFAARTRRFEPLWFRLGYRLYRILHRVLTGIPVRVGNFSVVPRRRLSALVAVSELWNHYAAAVFKSRIPYRTVPAARGVRLDGRSRMSFVPLLTHGLSAISVFGEIVGARLLMASMAMLGLLVIGVVTFSVVLGREPGLGDWSLWLVFLLVLVVSQIFLISAGSLFLSLYSRNRYDFLPLRDYRFFVEEVRSAT